jgi:hypothetical protein
MTSAPPGAFFEGTLADQDVVQPCSAIASTAPSSSRGLRVCAPDGGCDPTDHQSLPGRAMTVSVPPPRANDGPIEGRPARDHPASKLLPLTDCRAASAPRIQSVSLGPISQRPAANRLAVEQIAVE